MKSAITLCLILVAIVTTIPGLLAMGKLCNNDKGISLSLYDD